MSYLLDTSTIIDLLRGNQAIKDFIASHLEDIFVTSCICEAEIAEGIYREKEENIKMRKTQLKQLFSSFYQVLPFDSKQADIAGRIRAELGKEGRLIDDLDILIAAACLSFPATIITKNAKHFSRVKNLQICDCF